MSEPVRTERLSHERSQRRYPGRELVRGFEGGAVYSAEGAGEFPLITDESTMAEFLDDEDIGLVQDGETVRVFGTAGDREAYAVSHGWARRRRSA